MRSAPLLLTALVCAAPLAAQDAPVAAPPMVRLDSSAALALGRSYTTWFYAGQGDSLIAHSSAAVRAKVTATQLADIQEQLLAQVGIETTVIAERVVARDSLVAYQREVRFEMMDEPLVVVFTLGGGGDIYGFFIRPRSQMPAETPQP